MTRASLYFSVHQALVNNTRFFNLHGNHYRWDDSQMVAICRVKARLRHAEILHAVVRSHKTDAMSFLPPPPGSIIIIILWLYNKRPFIIFDFLFIKSAFVSIAPRGWYPQTHRETRSLARSPPPPRPRPVRISCHDNRGFILVLRFDASKSSAIALSRWRRVFRRGRAHRFRAAANRFREVEINREPPSRGISYRTTSRRSLLFAHGSTYYGMLIGTANVRINGAY